jgi:plasmid stabilization system protein ParE
VRVITLLEEAEDDLAEAALFLEGRNPGLDQIFCGDVGYALERLMENPYVGPEIEPGIRRLGLRRFPYNVVYKVLPDRVRILAVLHHRRSPEHWRDRL